MRKTSAEFVDAVERHFGADEAQDELSNPWLSDAPTDLDTEIDAFGVEGIVNELVRLISAAHPPFTLSLTGVWGSGKSTVAEALVARLRRNGKPAVLIDSWTEDIDQLRRTLVVAVAAAMRSRGDDAKEARERESVAKRIDDETRNSTTEPESGTRAGVLLTVRAFLRDPVAFSTSILLVLVLLVALSFAAPESIWARALAPILGAFVGFLLVNSGFLFVVRGITVTTGPAEAAVVLTREFRNSVTGSDLKNPPGRVLVVVDNLDRLPGEDAVKALAEIRSLVEIKGSRCVFLIPVDREALVGHIKGTLESRVEKTIDSELQAQARAANDYLDKFFNLDLVLTQPQPVDIRRWALGEAKRILQANPKDDLAEAVQIVAYAAGATLTAPAGASPRAVKRILNGISTRQHLLRDGQETLSQLAFVECIVTRFPGVLRWISQDTRRFVEFRRALAEGEDQERSQVFGRLPAYARGIDPDAARDFLTTFRDIEIGVAELGRMLSLRADRDWPGVEDAVALRAALWSGDADAFLTAMDTTPVEEHQAALLAAVARVESSKGTFHRDALFAIEAAVPSVGRAPAVANELRRVGTEALARADTTTVLRVSPEVAGFVFAPATVSRDARVFAANFVEAMKSVEAAAATTDHVRVVRTASGAFSQDTLSTARSLMAQLSFDQQTPLFEDSVHVGLVSGPVVEGYVGELATMSSDAAAAVEVHPKLHRLSEFRAAGGAINTDLEAVAVRLDQMVAAVSGSMPTEFLDFLDEMVRLLDEATGPGIDRLATTLTTRADPSRGRTFSAAFSLSLEDPTQQSAVRQFDAWLSEGSLDAGEAELVLRDHMQVLQAWSSVWTERLLAQWLGRQDGLAFARLVVSYGDDAAKDMLPDRVVGAPTEVLRLAGDVVELFSRDTTRLARLVANLASWIASATPASMTGLERIVRSILDAGGDSAPLLDAVRQRVTTAPVNELNLWVVVAADFELAGIPDAAHLADALASRGAAVGLADLEAARWIAKHTGDKASAAIVVSEAIRNTAHTVSEVVALADQVRGDLDRKAAGALALVQRAKVSTAHPTEVASLLGQAMLWRRQPPEAQDDYQRLLSEIAQELPEMDEQVVALKNRGKRVG